MDNSNGYYKLWQLLSREREAIGYVREVREVLKRLRMASRALLFKLGIVRQLLSKFHLNELHDVHLEVGPRPII